MPASMHRKGAGPRLRAWAVAAALALLCPVPAVALEPVTFEVDGGGDDLLAALRNASLLVRAEAQGTTSAQDLLSAARSDYARLLGVLYATGHYSGTIRIALDGSEAASIPVLDPPGEIGRATVRVTPGPVFAFGRARVAPLAPGTALPEGFRPGAPALSGIVGDAASAGVDGWRAAGHAKARIADQSVVADHRANRLDADIRLEPGPRLTFGRLSVTGQERMRERAIRRIAGLPVGETFDPEDLDRAAQRLQRTGIFSTVLLQEAERPNPDGTLDIGLIVDEAPRRRLTFGAELESREGLGLTASWLNRNLSGGGERFLAEARAEGIGGQTGIDYGLSLRLDRPGTVGPDTTGYTTLDIERETADDYTSDSVELGLGFTRRFSNRLTGDVGITAYAARVDEGATETDFRRVALPVRLTWDGRDSELDPKTGLYGDVTMAPFLGLAGTGNGLRVTADARAYRELGDVVAAGRLQAGTILGPSLAQTPRDDLFFSGGGGTVRGQPYQALGVTVLQGGTLKTGGQHFLGLSGEVRVPVTGPWGAVAFYDAGYVAATDFGDGAWHAGAGLGLRYDTGIGPIRLDLALPVSGDNDDGVQLYIGIGQAF